MPYNTIDETKFDAGADKISEAQPELQKLAENSNFFDMSGLTDGDILQYSSTAGTFLAVPSSNYADTDFNNVVTNTFTSSSDISSWLFYRNTTGGTAGGRIHYVVIGSGCPTSFTLPTPAYMNVGQDLKLIINNTQSQLRTVTLASGYLYTSTSIDTDINSNSGNDSMTIYTITKLNSTDYLVHNEE